MKVECAHAAMVDITDLKLNPRNPNKHPDEQVSLLAKNIRALGWRHPVIVSKRSGLVVAGHARIEAGKMLGVAAVPVDYQDFESEADELAYLIADNRIAELAERDNAVIKDLLEELDTGANDMDLTGYTEKAIEDLMTQEHQSGDADADPQIDHADELRNKWGTKRGQLWLIGKHRLLCGDSTKAEDVDRLMGNEMATCVFTDPPYGVSIGKKNEMLNTFHKAGRCLTSLDADDMTPEKLKEVLLAAFKLAREHMADDCSVFVCSPQGGGLGMMMMMMMMMMQESCLEVRHILNWIKNSPTFSMGRLDYDYQHEPILFTWKKTHKRTGGGQWKTSLWTVDKPRACKEHPTMKPIELPTNAILNHTDTGDIVLDMFGGSGTTMVAAENTGRRGRLVEISPGFAAVILERMKTAFPNIEIKQEPAHA